MPVFYNRLETIPTTLITRVINGSTSTFQHQLICLLFFVRKSLSWDPIPFLVPIILSVHIPLGLRFSPVSLDAPLTHHGRSYIRFLLNHTDGELTPPYISIWPTFRPVHSRFSSVLPHILTIGILQSPGLQVTPPTSGRLSCGWLLSSNSYGHSQPTSPSF